MKTNSPLYNALNTWLGQSVPWVHRAHLTTGVWMVVALLQRGEVNLTGGLPYLPCRGEPAQSKQRRVSRGLHNSWIDVHRLYKPLIRAVLAQWQSECLYLSLDSSPFWEQYCLVRLAVVHRGHALPVVWRVFKQDSASVANSQVSVNTVSGGAAIAIRGQGEHTAQSAPTPVPTQSVGTIRKFDAIGKLEAYRGSRGRATEDRVAADDLKNLCDRDVFLGGSIVPTLCVGMHRADALRRVIKHPNSRNLRDRVGFSRGLLRQGRVRVGFR